MKLAADGSFLWAKQLGGLTADIPKAIAVDTDGNVYTTGIFQGITDFDPGSGVYNLNGDGSNDIYISKLNTDGSFGWAVGFERGLPKIKEMVLSWMPPVLCTLPALS